MSAFQRPVIVKRKRVFKRRIKIFITNFLRQQQPKILMLKIMKERKKVFNARMKF